MMSICFKEGFQIAAPAVQNIIRACNQDIRQTINTLSMMASNNRNSKKKLEYDDVKECWIYHISYMPPIYYNNINYRL